MKNIINSFAVILLVLVIHSGMASETDNVTYYGTLLPPDNLIERWAIYKKDGQQITNLDEYFKQFKESESELAYKVTMELRKTKKFGTFDPRKFFTHEHFFPIINQYAWKTTAKFDLTEVIKLTNAEKNKSIRLQSIQKGTKQLKIFKVISDQGAQMPLHYLVDIYKNLKEKNFWIILGFPESFKYNFGTATMFEAYLAKDKSTTNFFIFQKGVVPKYFPGSGYGIFVCAEDSMIKIKEKNYQLLSDSNPNNNSEKRIIFVPENTIITTNKVIDEMAQLFVKKYGWKTKLAYKIASILRTSIKAYSLGVGTLLAPYIIPILAGKLSYEMTNLISKFLEVIVRP